MIAAVGVARCFKPCHHKRNLFTDSVSGSFVFLVHRPVGQNEGPLEKQKGTLRCLDIYKQT